MERAAVSIMGKVGQLLVDELQDIRGVGSKVVHLRDELATMNAALRIISEAEQDSVDHIVREWEKQVHDLACDAEDCTDTYLLRLVRPTPNPPSNVTGNQLIFSWTGYMLARAKRIAKYPYEKLVLQRTLAADIKDLLARATIVSERRVRYGIDRAVLPRAACFVPVSAAAASASALRPTNDPDQFVGITDTANALAGKIKAIKAPVNDRADDADKIRAPVNEDDDDDNDDDETMAAVHDQDDKIKAPVHEGLEVFSIVGFGGLGKTTLAMDLCRQLDADFPFQALVSVSQNFNAAKDMERLLVQVLQQILREKPSDEQTNLTRVEELSEKIRELLHQKSKIIVTTRINMVAKAASFSEDFVHRMEPLKPKASEKLFVKKVFGYTENSTCPPELKETMDTILKKCGGLPLAIISIARLLPSNRSAESIEMWKRVSRSIGSQMEIHPTLQAMRQLITLSYDYLPHHLKACMMYLSIFPEDYVVTKDRLLHRWIAEGLVTEKRGLTLLEVAEEYLNELISRNMIQLDKFVSTEKSLNCRESNFVTLVGRQYGGMTHGHGKVRRLSVHDNDNDEQHDARHGIEAMKLQHVRSLTTFPFHGLDKLLDRLGEFKLLRVLDLEDCKALRNKHMIYVCRLYLLRFLSLRGTTVSKMPHKLGNLEHLQTLDVKDTYMNRGQGMPRSVTKLSKLESLMSDGMLIADSADGGCYPELASSLSKTSALRSLNLSCGGAEGDECSLEFLHDVSPPPPLLHTLVLCGSISQLPDWMSSLAHLTNLEIGYTELTGDKLFRVLCKLTNLQRIRLVEIECKYGKLVARPKHDFPVLRFLEVVECPIMLTFQKGSMKMLETLVLDFGDERLRTVGLQNLENLKEVKLNAKKSIPSMKCAVKQLKRHPKSNQMRVMADWS
ncbi:disease resistance protein PIK6-NP-like [Triticum dicoccoides]|uniref:disease resistance protein PIK6-NP-like n=1 Tax=Triticum dicoccoides TaxID=85692 RepID=UPI0018915763|nr:disease resistance protein PIK6-NP-like [Triticum dicoccoides]